MKVATCAASPAARVWARLSGVPLWAQAVAGLLLLAFYAQRIWTVYRDTGLFRRLGFDWGLFYSQASAFAAGDIGAMYRIDHLTPYLQRLTPFTMAPDVPLLQWPSPYPPLLAALLAPLTLIPPPLAFGIWTALSLAAAGHLVWRVHQLLPGAGAIRLALIFITTLPVLQTLLLGQPVLLLASALAESFLALRRGADFRGGLWLGLLAIKPQYGLILGVFLLWKRRWWAVAGAALVVGLVVGGSALVAGPSALSVPLAAAWRSAIRAPWLRLAILGLLFLPTVGFVWVTGLVRGLAINYDDPLWVVWPVLTAALLLVVLGAMLLTLVPAHHSG
ncbi:MAG: DUF2029 domain-containing protein [Chloroflexi bacterium]|nr:DUF2029 domain-containing protein [Chloroflexota bacterium]